MPIALEKSAAVYRPCQSRESDFHRLVREHFDTFRAIYTERYASKFGHWRPIYGKTVRHFLKCGDLQNGFARPRCPMPEADAGVSYEVDPEYLEHARLQAFDEQDQPELPWDA